MIRLMNIKRRTRITLMTLFLALLASILVTTSALAHIRVGHTEPADGAVLIQAPRELRISFDAAFLPKFLSARVLDINGRAIEGVDVQQDSADPTLLRVRLPALTPGVYNVLYRVISADDNHFTQGHLVFRVGAGAAVTSGNAGGLTDWSLVEGLVHWLNLTTLAALVGALAVTQLVLAPATRRSDLAPSMRAALQVAQACVKLWAVWSGVLAFAVGFALLGWQAIEAAPVGAGGAQILSAGWGFLISARWGTLWFTRQGLLLLIMTAALMHYRHTRHSAHEVTPSWASDVSLAGLTLALLAVQALTSHAAALPVNTVPALIVDTLHLLAASFWMGGLLALAIGLLPVANRHRRDAEQSQAVADVMALLRVTWGSFSRLAVVSVALLVVTGLYSAGRQVASLDALLTTFYGQLVLSKVGLLVGAGAIGLLNAALLHARVASPVARLLRRPTGWMPLPLTRLPILVLIEVILGLGLFGATGLLTSLPPARGAEFAAAPAVPQSLSQLANDLLVTSEVKPNRPGPNVITLHIANTRRPVPAPILQVTTRFAFPAENLASPTVNAVEIESGVYQVGGNYLSRAGRWQIDVMVQRPGQPVSVAHFDWSVADAVDRRPLFISNRPLEPLLTVVAIIIALLLSGLLIWSWSRARGFIIPQFTWLYVAKPDLRLEHKE